MQFLQLARKLKTYGGACCFPVESDFKGQVRPVRPWDAAGAGLAAASDTAGLRQEQGACVTVTAECLIFQLLEDGKPSVRHLDAEHGTLRLCSIRLCCLQTSVEDVSVFNWDAVAKVRRYGWCRRCSTKPRALLPRLTDRGQAR